VKTLLKTPNGPISLRPAQESDALAFRELRLEALRNHPEAFSADYALNEAEPPTFWSNRLRTLGNDGRLYFAIHEDKLIGMCGIGRGNSPKTRHSATIWGVYVKSAWRGSQIAEGLINECAQWAKTHEIKLLKLGVVTTNTAAIRCYLRCGFTVYGVEPQAIYCNDRLYDELLMARIF
jgi:RimJ/RimL family protein N-acetyltransferase